MMELSISIVNFNAKEPLRQCLRSIQDNIKNRWAPLEVKPTNFDIEITVVPNPVNIIGKNIINGSFDQNATIKVKVILGPNTIIYLKKGQLNIYDPVGNLVISLDGTLVDDDKNGIFETFVFKWDGKSSYGKTVGGSAYVCIATIENDQGIKRSIKAMIGVQSDNVRTNE